MRVAIFTDNDFDKVNGVTTTLTAVLQYAPADVKPRIYTAARLGRDGPDYLALPSYGVPIPFYAEMRMYLPRWRRYLKCVVADQISVLHLTTPGPIGLTALWLAKETGIPLIGSFHTNLGTYTSILSGSARLGRWMDLYMRWMYGRCRHVLVPSAATRDALSRAGLPAERLSIWTRGVDADLFTPAKRSAELRKQWRADADHVVLLYVGRISKEKGLELLPSLVDRLRALGIGCRVVLAGDGPFRRELSERCPGAIFTGVLGRERLAEVFASADVFVFPSRTDTAGNVVLEAQASGLPVLVSDAGGPRENIVPDVTGLICASEEGERWANTVAATIRFSAERRRMSAAARQYALSRRWELALDPLFETYRRVHQDASERAVKPAA